MTALAAARATKSRNLGDKRSYDCAVDICYAGGLAMMNAAGYIQPAAADAGNKGCVGVFTKTVDNSGGSAGDLKAEVQEGDFLFDGDTLGVDDNGSIVYADDDQTLDETQAANTPIAGTLVEYVSASSGWVRVGVATAR